MHIADADPGKVYPERELLKGKANYVDVEIGSLKIETADGASQVYLDGRPLRNVAALTLTWRPNELWRVKIETIVDPRVTRAT